MKQINLTSGSLWSGIFIFSIPLVFSNILQVLFNLADVAVVGRFAGPLSLGAVGSTPQLIFFFVGILQGIGGGVNVIAAYNVGAREKKDLSETVHTSFIICLLFGIGILVLCQIFAVPVLSILKTKDELIELAALYVKIYVLSMPATAIYNWGNALLNAIGDTKRPLIFLLIAGIINVVLNLIFVIVFNMDVAGVAWASVISQYISAILILITICKGSQDIKLDFKKLKLSSSKVKRILRIGLPAGLQNSIFAFANMFIQFGVNSFDSMTVAGISASSQADPICYEMMAAFYAAGASFIGQNHGAGNKERVKQTYLISMLYSFFAAVIFSVILWIFRYEFMNLFTTNQAVIDSGIKRIAIMCLTYGCSCLMDNTIAACRGLGHTIVPSLVVSIGSCLFRIVWIYTVFAYFGTINSLFALYAVSWTLTGIAEIFYFIYIFKKEFKYK